MQDIQSVTWSLWGARGLRLPLLSGVGNFLTVVECSLSHFCGAVSFGAIRAFTGAAHTILSAMSLHFKPDCSL